MRARKNLLWGVLVLLSIAAFYAPAVRLPFFSDDIPTQRYLTQATLWDILSRIDMNGTYYRPFANLFYKYVPLESTLWHSVMLWAHLLNTALLGVFLRLLGVGAGGRIAAMAWWGLFPFNVQAVVWVGAGFHVLLVGLVLLACVGALSWWVTPHRVPLLAWVAGFLAPFAHETGVLTAALVMLALWMRGGGRVVWAWRRVVVLLLPMLTGALLYTLVRQAIINGSAGVLREPLEVLHNAAFFAQGFSLPTQFAAGVLGGDALGRSLLASALWTTGVLLLAWRVPIQRRRVLGALAWAGVSLAPACLLLHPAYVGYGERLGMVAVPSMVVWVAVIWETGGRLAVPLRLVLLLTLAASLAFGREYLRLHLLHGEALRTLFVQLADEDAQARHVFVNMPSHIERTTPTLPLARAHAGLFTDWLTLRDFLWLNTGLREWHAADAIYTPDLVTLWDGYWQRFGGDVTLDMYETATRWGAADVVWRNHNATPQHYFIDKLGERLPQEAGAPLATYADALAIEGVRLRHLPDGRGQLAVDWRVLAPLDDNKTAFVHWLCGDVLVAQSDGDLFDNLYAFSRVPVGVGWRDFRYSPPLDKACLQARVGVYDRTNGAPLGEVIIVNTE